MSLPIFSVPWGYLIVDLYNQVTDLYQFMNGQGYFHIVHFALDLRCQELRLLLSIYPLQVLILAVDEHEAIWVRILIRRSSGEFFHIKKFRDKRWFLKLVSNQCFKKYYQKSYICAFQTEYRHGQTDLMVKKAT